MSKIVLPPFAALKAFAAVGHGGGIRKGADLLGVSHAIVSRHLSDLEQRLGTLLLNRKTGQLTKAGTTYHLAISRAIADMEAATAAVESRRRTSLTIWCSPGFALHWLTKRLPDFGGVRNRPIIDLRSTDSEPAFEREEADGDIRYLPGGARSSGAQDVRILELARPQVFPVASPEFLAGIGRPIETAADLLQLPLIEETNDAEWRLWFDAQGVNVPSFKPPVARYGQAHLTMAAARAGQGIALSNRYLVAEDLAASRLHVVEPGNGQFRPVDFGAYIFRASRARWHDPALVRFRNWLKDAIASD